MNCLLSTSSCLWQSGPDLSSGSVIIHQALGSCINAADLFPFAATHQAIKTTVSGTVSVSNASIAPHKGQCTIRYCPLDNALEARSGRLSHGSPWWLTQATPVQSLPGTTSSAVHQRCSLLWCSIMAHHLRDKIQRSRAVRKTWLYSVCGGQASREIPTRQGASGAPRSEPGRHRPRTEDHDSTTHIDVKLHAFRCLVGLLCSPVQIYCKLS
jgi:hypothetical protein